MILHALMFPPAKPLKGLIWLVIKSGRERLAELRLNKAMQFAFWAFFFPPLLFVFESCPIAYQALGGQGVFSLRLNM